MATTQNFEGLLSFFRNPANQCFWDEDNVIVKESPVGGTGVFAAKDLSAEYEDDALILRISKESILSSKTSCIANLLHDNHITGIHAMILSFLYEKSIGKASPWFDYINSINIYKENGDLILPPSLWPDTEKALLKGTEAEVLGVTDITEPEEFFAISIQFAKNISHLFPIPYELDANIKDTKEENLKKFHLFVAYCASIASRAFAIDDYHEVALVPGADLFNHDSYFNENVHFETVSDVCPFCGDADGCGHSEHGPPDSEVESSEEEEEGEEGWEDMDVDEEEEEEEEEPVEDIKEITMDYIKQMEEELEAERLAEEEEAEDDEQDEDEQGEGEDDEEDDEEENDDAMSESESLVLIPDDCVDIVLRKDVKEGEEIFNTYGDLSNSVLIARYGFSSPYNPNDYVGLGRQALKMEKIKKYKKHFEFWEDQGFEMFQDYLQFKKNELHVHVHDHDHHDHDEEGCCDEEEHGGCCGDEEEENLEDSWELELRILFNGEPSESTYALASLLTLTDIQLLKLIKLSDPEKIIEALAKLTDPKKQAYKIIQDWCKERSNLYNDGGLTSGEYDQVILKLEDGHTKSISLLIQSEKLILEKCFKFLDSRV